MRPSSSVFPPRALLLLLLGLLPAVLGTAVAQDASDQPGFLEIRATNLDGAAISLSGTPQGIIEDGGALISSVYPGSYELRVELEPYRPILVPVTVKPGEGLAVSLTAPMPEIEVSTVPARQQATLDLTRATLLVRCKPMECRVHVTGADATTRAVDQVQTARFGDQALLFAGLPQGAYSVTLTGMPDGPEITVQQSICDGETVGLDADFVVQNGRVLTGTTQAPDCPAVAPTRAQP